MAILRVYLNHIREANSIPFSRQSDLWVVLGTLGPKRKLLLRANLSGNLRLGYITFTFYLKFYDYNFVHFWDAIMSSSAIDPRTRCYDLSLVFSFPPGFLFVFYHSTQRCIERGTGDDIFPEFPWFTCSVTSSSYSSLIHYQRSLCSGTWRESRSFAVL